jgi:DNA-nicking Smr family endonuclease
MNKQLQQSDLELFREEVQGTEPVQHDLVEHERRKPPPIPRARESLLPEQQNRPSLSESEVQTPEFLLFSRPGVQRRLLAELQRGAIEVGLSLDLHGRRTEEARTLLDAFLADCAQRRVRCALIVHGKGFRSPERQPVLKQKVNYWLRLYPQVLAFCSAPRRDGGTGATYVLLRNPNKGRDTR